MHTGAYVHFPSSPGNSSLWGKPHRPGHGTYMRARPMRCKTLRFSAHTTSFILTVVIPLTIVFVQWMVPVYCRFVYISIFLTGLRAGFRPKHPVSLIMMFSLIDSAKKWSSSNRDLPGRREEQAWGHASARTNKWVNS